MASNSQEALNELQTLRSGRRSSQQVLQEAQNRVGLPSATQRQAGLRAAITNTENLIRAVEPSVNGRTSGTLTTEAQRSRLVGLERAPLDESFRTQSQAYQGATDELTGLKSQALQEAQLGIADEDAKISAAEGLYNNLYQREQDAIAKAERDRAFEEARKQAAAQASYLANLGRNGSTSRTTTAAPKTDPVQQTAYNDVATRINSQSDAELKSDYAATAASAGYGNLKDKYKLQLYHRLRPDLFGSGVNANALANGGQLRF